MTSKQATPGSAEMKEMFKMVFDGDFKASLLDLQKKMLSAKATREDTKFAIEMKLYRKKLETKIETDRIAAAVSSNLRIQKEVAEIIIGTSQLGIEAFSNMPASNPQDEMFKQNSISVLQQDCLIATKTVNQSLLDYLNKIDIPLPTLSVGKLEASRAAEFFDGAENFEDAEAYAEAKADAEIYADAATDADAETDADAATDAAVSTTVKDRALAFTKKMQS